MTMLTLAPMGRRLDLAEGTPLRDVLFGEGVEFPCGGVGRCKACRVRVIDGAMTALPEDLAAFSLDEIRDGWRLACRHRVEGDVTLALAQWQMAVLDDTEDFVFTPREGLGIAIDLGTTTIAAQLLDLKTGQVLAAKTALNAQARHGADLLTRAAYAMAGGASELTALIHGQIGAMVAALSCDAGQIVIAGNSAMHHFFGGLDITPLATHPFLPQRPQALRLSGTDLGWRTNAAVDVLACVGGMVGGDVLAGVMATGLSHKPGLVALVDLGTNGEVVVAQGGRLLCTSTAAGPAFEGARITHGMRAATGALDAVDAHGNCHVIGNGVARGICGSGLVDAVAAGLAMGLISPSGRLERDWALCDDVVLTPQDVRQLQLAKGAIAAGLTLLTARFGKTPAGLDALYLAGAFGNAISPISTVRIGLLPVAPERIVPVGNAALKGAKRALFQDVAEFETLAAKIDYVPLHEEPQFQDAFAEAMGF